MSDIVIRGIEMPKGKPLNLSIYPNGEVVLFCIQGRDVYDNECNYGDYKHKKIAVELPEHGRLGDLDKLKSQIINKRYEKPSHAREKHYNEVLDILFDTQIVLEASE